MAKTKKVFIGLTLAGCVIAIGLITAALATDYWVVSQPTLELKNETNTGSVNFGLFHGNQNLNYLGARPKEIWAVCNASFGQCFWSGEPSAEGREQNLQFAILDAIDKNESVKDYALTYGMFDYGLWVGTIVMAALGIAWGLIAFGFGCFNVLSHPIETITGPVGLYVWNAIAAFFTLLCVILYTVLYYQDLKVNILLEVDLENQWVSKGTTPGYSFWLVVGATLAFAINILLVFLGGVNLRLPSYSSTAEKNLDGVMMY
ncbi:clarin-3-like isoform X1 [Liolophura sinensis]|uniref:clarin-3-like isoform X1 n=1 Tax=Liolophura sinensis TaxID=3198878 RepID=UPI003158CEA3